MKIPAQALPEIVRRHNAGESYTALAREFSTTPWNIQKRIKNYHNGKTKKSPTKLASLKQRDWRAKKTIEKTKKE
jgi:hypothetical protein